MILLRILTSGTIIKAMGLKNGASLIVAMPMSIGFIKAIKVIIKDVSTDALYLPIIVITFCIAIYFSFFIVDFLTGLAASKKESTDTNWVMSSKLYSSIGKMGSVLLVNVLMLSIVLFLCVMHAETTSELFLFISVTLNVLMILYEFHSIGENIQRATGTKPDMFLLFEKITTIVENKFLKKIENK